MTVLLPIGAKPGKGTPVAAGIRLLETVRQRLPD